MEDVSDTLMKHSDIYTAYSFSMTMRYLSAQDAYCKNAMCRMNYYLSNATSKYKVHIVEHKSRMPHDFINRMSWDDLRLVRAICETGSLTAAATQIGVNHSTVFRRLGSLEDLIGVKLFER